MIKINRWTAIAILLIISSALQAQSIQTSAEIKMKIIPELNVFAEGEYRTHDGLSSTERWSGTVGLDYKMLPYLKLSGGYAYIHQQTEEKITRKGNIVPSYWQPKHRLFLAITGNYEWKRLTFSLRERYQYTYRKGQYVPKYDGDGITPKDDEWVKSKNKHLLRSRIEIKYNIKKCKFTPYVSYECYHSMSEDFAFDKSRISIGTDYKLSKKQTFGLFYRYVDRKDDDEVSGHIIGIGYKLKI